MLFYDCQFHFLLINLLKFYDPCFISFIKDFFLVVSFVTNFKYFFNE